MVKDTAIVQDWLKTLIHSNFAWCSPFSAKMKERKI